MEIKTLEEYILNELKLRDESIENLKLALLSKEQEVTSLTEELTIFKSTIKEFFIDMRTCIDQASWRNEDLRISCDSYIYKTDNSKIFDLLTKLFNSNFDELLKDKSDKSIYLHKLNEKKEG